MQRKLATLDSLIFDLDGTLWDTCPACAVAWNNVLRRHRISFREIVADDIRRVCGKPHDLCINEIFHSLPSDVLALLSRETALEDNRVIAKMGGTVYPGVREGLAALQEEFPLFIVSNCQAGYIETFLKLNSFSGFFRDHECWGNTGRPKAANIRCVMERNDLRRPIYIGDTNSDAHAASDCGIAFAHVTYGFGELSDAPLRFPSFAALTSYLLTN